MSHMCSALQVIKAVKAETSGASERNKQLAQRMRDALANNQAAYRSLKQDTLLFRQDALFCPPVFSIHMQLQQVCSAGLFKLAPTTSHVPFFAGIYLQYAANRLLSGEC